MPVVQRMIAAAGSWRSINNVSENSQLQEAGARFLFIKNAGGYALSIIKVFLLIPVYIG